MHYLLEEVYWYNSFTSGIHHKISRKQPYKIELPHTSESHLACIQVDLKKQLETISLLRTSMKHLLYRKDEGRGFLRSYIVAGTLAY